MIHMEDIDGFPSAYADAVFINGVWKEPSGTEAKFTKCIAYLAQYPITDFEVFGKLVYQRKPGWSAICWKEGNIKKAYLIQAEFPAIASFFEKMQRVPMRSSMTDSVSSDKE